MDFHTRWRCRDCERFSDRDEGYRPSCVLSITVALIKMVGRLDEILVNGGLVAKGLSMAFTSWRHCRGQPDHGPA
jgi:hypothetical protein